MEYTMFGLDDQQVAPMAFDRLLGLEPQQQQQQQQQLSLQPQQQQLYQQQGDLPPAMPSGMNATGNAYAPAPSPPPGGANPSYYRNLSVSLMNLPVSDASSQVLRPPDLFDMAQAPQQQPSEALAPSHPKAAKQAAAAPWAGLFTNGPSDGGLAAKTPQYGALVEQVQAPQSLRYEPEMEAPMLQVRLRPEAAAPVAAPAPEDKAPAAPARPQGGKRRRCLPETQRAKRKAITDLFLKLKQTCYGDAMGRDPAVTAVIGRGRRSVNSKEAILRKAGADIAELTARAEKLEREVQTLENEARQSAAPSPSTGVPSPASPEPVSAEAAAAQRSASLAAEYRNSSAARFLSTPDGRLIDHSSCVSAVLNTPAAVLEQASRGDMPSFVLVPSQVRASYYEVLRTLLDADGPSTGVAQPASGGGRLVVTRCGTGRDAVIDHLWVA